MSKIQIISDKNVKSKKIRFEINKLLIRHKIINDHKKIIVIGGDGFMLQTLRKKNNKKNFFYGINSGNYGFLMNKFSPSKFINNFIKSKPVKIFPLEVFIKTINNKKKKVIAINEVSVFRQSKQTAALSVKKNSRFIIKQLISDGILVSTPAGSTAYNLSVNGPILDLNSKKLSIVPISPFRPRRWIGKIVSDKSVIIITNLDVKKRPIGAVADNLEIRNVKKLTIKSNKKNFFNLLYDEENSLQKKIKLEQIKKETN